MSQVSSERLREVYTEHGGDPVKVAAALGLSTQDLAARLTIAPVPVSRRRKPPADVGKDYFRSYIVSIRHAEHTHWPEADLSKIEQARANYEAGTHEICQGRDRDWFVLYCVPRKTRVGARKFFRTEF